METWVDVVCGLVLIGILVGLGVAGAVFGSDEDDLDPDRGRL